MLKVQRFRKVNCFCLRGSQLREIKMMPTRIMKIPLPCLPVIRSLRKRIEPNEMNTKLRLWKGYAKLRSVIERAFSHRSIDGKRSPIQIAIDGFFRIRMRNLGCVRSIKVTPFNAKIPRLRLTCATAFIKTLSISNPITGLMSFSVTSPESTQFQNISKEHL